MDYLTEKGFSVLDKNWYFQKSEVDLIVQKGTTLVAVEVKTRSSREFGDPQDFIDRQKIKRLVKAMDDYIRTRDLEVELRFDIIAIVIRKEHYSIEHIEDAFLYF